MEKKTKPNHYALEATRKKKLLHAWGGQVEFSLWRPQFLYYTQVLMYLLGEKASNLC